ncbi:MAG: CBS domain-containing protein [Nanoarchaeota archaeon]
MKNPFKDLDKIATEIPVSKIMVKNIRKIKETDSAQKAIDIMSLHSISGLIVFDKAGTPVGMISEGDLLKKVFHKKKNPEKTKIKEIMNRGLKTIEPEMSIGETAVLMKKHKISKLPVFKDKKLLGLVTKSDLLEELNNIYKQNRRFHWVAVIITIQFIIIAVLVISLIGR